MVQPFGKQQRASGARVMFGDVLLAAANSEGDFNIEANASDDGCGERKSRSDGYRAQDGRMEGFDRLDG